ncbi:MAG: LCP family protein, partial [Actinobacteria bacterium]|nr:LCP family protein [Actinomycetota bacterium]
IGAFAGHKDGMVYNIAKAIDGITVDLCRAVDDTGAHNIAEGNGPVGSGFKMSAGTHDLTPEQSLQFVRQRHNLPGDDLGREARQRYFLGAAFKKIESAGTLLNPSKLTDLVSAIKSTLTVDQDISLQSLADQMINLSAGNIVGQTIPTQGSQDYSGAVGTALDVDPAKVRGQIQAWFAGPKPHTPPTTTPSGGTKTPTAPRPSNGASSVQQVAPNTGCIN